MGGGVIPAPYLAQAGRIYRSIYLTPHLPNGSFVYSGADGTKDGLFIIFALGRDLLEFLAIPVYRDVLIPIYKP